MIVDSHCHLDRLDLSGYDGDLGLALNQAKAWGVSHFLTVCVSLDEFDGLLKIANEYKDVSCSVGVHPTDGETDVVSLEDLVRLGQHKKVVAVGETGLDYYRSSKEVIPVQQENFRQHIRASIKLKKPLIIHTRMAQADTIAILKEEGAHEVGGVMHCFTEDWSMAEQALDLGFYISISGIVTFKNAEIVNDVARRVPSDRLLIETDSPYLAPVPHRGKTNQPAYVRYVAEYMASLRGVEFSELAAQTTKNFCDLFSIKV